MCQNCIDQGRFSQEEYDQRILAGDTSIVPMMDLDITEVIKILAESAATAEESGMPHEQALALAREELAVVMAEQAERDRSIT